MMHWKFTLFSRAPSHPEKFVAVSYWQNSLNTCTAIAMLADLSTSHCLLALFQGAFCTVGLAEHFCRKDSKLRNVVSSTWGSPKRPAYARAVRMANTRSNGTLGSDRPHADGEERAPRMMQGSGRTGAAVRPAGADQARQEACCQGRTQQLPPESYFKLRGVYHKKKVIYRSSKGNLAQSSG